MKTLYALPILFVSTACLLHADTTITSGTIQATGGQRPTLTVQLQGPNLSLSGTTYDGIIGLAHVDGNFQNVNFNPNGSVSNSSLGLYLTYNGNDYGSATPFVVLQMNTVGPLVTVPNTFPPIGPYPGGNYQGDTSNIPFSMTGLITVHSGTPTGPTILSVPISGSGLYSGHAQGNYLALGPGGIPFGLVTFQFTTAPFLDTTTQGAWNGKYGADGYVIASGATRMPSFAAVTVNGASTFTWAGQTSDPRALQNGAGTTTGIASAFTQYPNNSITMNVNIVDGKAHMAALYLLDWDSTTRSQTITLTDVRTNTIIDSQVYSNFHNGEYTLWNLQGNTNITVTPSNGGTPAVSGIFFGAAVSVPAPPTGQASAALVNIDPVIRGAWIDGGYGLNGYMIANGPSKPSTYAIASVTGAIPYTWAGQVADARVLQSTMGSNVGIASAYTQYPGASFNININIIDGTTRNIALYLLDWDGAGRSETITIRDANSNAVLSTATFSGFQNGQYPSWNIKGNVVINVKPNNGSTPVVSGIFFN